MANPNIVDVTSIYGKLAQTAVSTGSVNIVSNASSSGKIFKINSLIISNVDGANAADITCQISNNGSTTKLANTISVPADATLVLISKDTSIYLPENSHIQVWASASSDLHAICSYEEIS